MLNIRTVFILVLGEFFIGLSFYGSMIPNRIIKNMR